MTIWRSGRGDRRPYRVAVRGPAEVRLERRLRHQRRHRRSRAHREARPGTEPYLRLAAAHAGGPSPARGPPRPAPRRRDPRGLGRRPPSYRLAERPDDFAIVVGSRNTRASPLPSSPSATPKPCARTWRRWAIRSARSCPSRATMRAGDYRRYLKSCCQERQARLGGVLLLLGHGAPDAETKKAYLVPWDASPQFCRHRLRLRRPLRPARRAQAGRVVVASIRASPARANAQSSPRGCARS